MWDSLSRSRSRSRLISKGQQGGRTGSSLTLLAGFDFNFSKIFCDWALVARLILTGMSERWDADAECLTVNGLGSP